MDVVASFAILALPVALIVLAALALALGGLLQYRLAAWLAPETRVAAVLAIVGIGAILSVALTSRTLNEAQLSATEFVTWDDYAKGFAASRWLSLLLLGAAVVEAIRGWLRARAESTRDPAESILWSAVAFYLGTLVIQSVGSDHIGFSHKDLYLPIVLVAVYYQRVERLEGVLETAKWVLFALVSGSLAGIFLSPDFVMHRPDPGLIPGVDWRLFGLTSHANALGPAALVAVVLEVATRSRSSRLRWLRLGAAVAVLVFAQSRSTWAAGIAVVALVSVPLALRPEAGRRAQQVAFRRAAWTLIACIAATIALAFAFVGFGATDYLQRRAELTTLNGRFLIWDITLRAWRENPLFGYGADVWGLDRQFRYYMFHVGHAHNQVVQTLGEAGLAGLALLAAFLGALLRAAVLRFAESRGLLLALLLVLLARCVTEAPMRSDGLLTWSTFLHVLIVVLACHYLRRPARERPRGAVRAPSVPRLGNVRLGTG